jgi:hypothetical protein
MRVTFGEFRGIMRAPGPGGATGIFSGPTLYPVRQSAVARYHSEGLAAAEAALDRGLSGYWSRPGGPSTQARNLRAQFARYVVLDRADGRPAAAVPLGSDVPYGPHTIGVSVDVVLFDAAGYAARLLLWDTAPFSSGIAHLYAAPAVSAVEQELGLPVTHVDVWQLRAGEEIRISRGAALSYLPEVQRRLDVTLGNP